MDSCQEARRAHCLLLVLLVLLLLLLLVLLLLLHLLFLLLVLKESFMPAAVCHGWQHVYTANIPALLLRGTKNSLARNEESTVITKCDKVNEWKKSKV